jgi:GTPase SAR1 family protein
MSESKDQFKGIVPQADSVESSSAPPPPQNVSAPQVPGEVNLERIDTRRISGPLVVFFGPREIGKTVTLLRLCTYLRSSYRISPDESFRTDDRYSGTSAAFETLLGDMQLAPEATGNINFLLLNITHDGGRFCQFLESPGEQFFDRSKPNAPYPNYMNRILAEAYPKVFVFFFELNMFRSDDDLRNYSDKLARLVSEKISSKRDHVVILCNKADLHPHFRGGMPIKSEYKKAIYDQPSFKSLKDALRNSGFTYVPFVPFSAGAFNDDGTGQKVFALSPEHYPKHLWKEIHDTIQGPSVWGSLWNIFR